MPPIEHKTLEKLETELATDCHTVGDLNLIASPSEQPPALKAVLISATALELILTMLSAGRRIVAVNELPKLPGYTWLTEEALRHIVRAGTPRMAPNGKPIATNGLDKYEAIIRLGSGIRARVLIDLDRFDAWIDEHRQKPLSPTKP